MRTSTLLASALFGSLAMAAPVNKRAKVTKTEVVVETLVVYVTEWLPQAPIATPTAPGLFYEQPAKKESSSTIEATTTTTTPVVVEPTSTSAPAYTPPVEVKPTSTSTPAYTAPVVVEPTSTSTPAPPPSTTAAPEYTSTPSPPAQASSTPVKEEPTPTPVVEEPTPVVSSTSIEREAPAYTTPATPTSSSAPAPETSPVDEPGTEFKGKVTVYDTYSSKGACGTTLSDTEYTAAVSHAQWNDDENVWLDNGLNQNPWCGKKATVTLKGKTVTVKIMDKCMGCSPGDIDLTRAPWNELTNTAYGDKLDGAWSS